MATRSGETMGATLSASGEWSTGGVWTSGLGYERCRNGQLSRNQHINTALTARGRARIDKSHQRYGDDNVQFINSGDSSEPCKVAISTSLISGRNFHAGDCNLD